MYRFCKGDRQGYNIGRPCRPRPRDPAFQYSAYCVICASLLPRPPYAGPGSATSSEADMHYVDSVEIAECRRARSPSSASSASKGFGLGLRRIRRRWSGTVEGRAAAPQVQRSGGATRLIPMPPPSPSCPQSSPCPAQSMVVSRRPGPRMPPRATSLCVVTVPEAAEARVGRVGLGLARLGQLHLHAFARPTKQLPPPPPPSIVVKSATSTRHTKAATDRAQEKGRATALSSASPPWPLWPAVFLRVFRPGGKEAKVARERIQL